MQYRATVVDLVPGVAAQTINGWIEELKESKTNGTTNESNRY